MLQLHGPHFVRGHAAVRINSCYPENVVFCRGKKGERRTQCSITVTKSVSKFSIKHQRFMEIWNCVFPTISLFAKQKNHSFIRGPLSDCNERLWCLQRSFKWEYNPCNPGQFIQYLWACTNSTQSRGTRGQDLKCSSQPAIMKAF